MVFTPEQQQQRQQEQNLVDSECRLLPTEVVENRDEGVIGRRVIICHLLALQTTGWQ